MALIDKVKDLINIRKYNIISSDSKDDIDTVVSEAVIVAINRKTKQAHISYEVSMRPDEAAIFSVNIVNINPNFTYIMNPCFMIDQTGNILCGDEAYQFYNQMYSQSVIEGFLEEQQKLHMLHHMKPGGTA